MRVLHHRLEQLSLLHSYRNLSRAFLTRSRARRFCEFWGLKGLKGYLEPVGDVSHQGGNKGLIFWRGDDSWWPSIPAHTTAADKGYSLRFGFFFLFIYRGAITMIPWRGALNAAASGQTDVH